MAYTIENTIKNVVTFNMPKRYQDLKVLDSVTNLIDCANEIVIKHKTIGFNNPDNFQEIVNDLKPIADVFANDQYFSENCTRKHQEAFNKALVANIFQEYYFYFMSTTMLNVIKELDKYKDNVASKMLGSTSFSLYQTIRGR